MRKAILVTGPQGAGKSTFCKEITKCRPDVVLIERDAIFIEIFGDKYLDPYSGAHYYGPKVMWERVAEKLKTNENIDLLLDTWCGHPGERSWAGKNLRSLGADQVDLWCFVTPEDVCVKQYEIREGPKWSSGIREINLECCRKNFRTWHRMPLELNMEESVFDNIRMINPLQLTFIPYCYLLL